MLVAHTAPQDERGGRQVLQPWEPELDEGVAWKGRGQRPGDRHFWPVGRGARPGRALSVGERETLGRLRLGSGFRAVEIRRERTVAQRGHALLWRRCPPCALNRGNPVLLCLGRFPLLLVGTEEQKERYLGELVAGNAISFALSEEGAGSDASALRTTATREANAWRIVGEKIYIGNGGASRYYVVFAKVADENDGGRQRVTAFMVDRESDGVTIDRYESKMGIRGALTSNLKLNTVVTDGDMLGIRRERASFSTTNTKCGENFRWQHRQTAWRSVH